MRTRLSIFGLAAVGALVLAACGGSDGDSSSDTAASIAETTTTTVEPVPANTTVEPAATTNAPTTTAAAAAVTDPPATDPPMTVAAADTDGSCLVGEWVVTEEEMNKFYGAIEATIDVPLTLEVEGSAPLTLSVDGTYRWDPEFTLVVEVAGTVGTGEASGDITGDWSATEGVLTTASDVNALEVFITVGGVTIEGDDIANGFLNSSPINGVTYACDGPAPVLDFNTGDPKVTVPITLTPA
jgi:hypothetical protein